MMDKKDVFPPINIRYEGNRCIAEIERPKVKVFIVIIREGRTTGKGARLYNFGVFATYDAAKKCADWYNFQKAAVTNNRHAEIEAYEVKGADECFID